MKHGRYINVYSVVQRCFKTNRPPFLNLTLGENNAFKC